LSAGDPSVIPGLTAGAESEPAVSPARKGGVELTDRLRSAPPGKVVVLGSQGMVGQTVFRHLSRSGCEVIGTQFADPQSPWYLDATADARSWRPIIEDVAYVINCIGVLKSAIDVQSAASLAAAIRVNSLFPHELARIAAETGARVIHISTDGVFAGGRTEPYVESDTPDCQDSYGWTKALGECPAENVLNIRCSIVGLDAIKHKGLLEWFLRQPDASLIDGFPDQQWNGVTSLQFARVCERLMQKSAFDCARRASSVHHFCPNSAISKLELLQTWRRLTNKNVEIHGSDTRGADRLLGTNFNSLTPPDDPRQDWTDLLQELLTA
jgi:dTDP-4-dehydrorhamnose reductase